MRLVGRRSVALAGALGEADRVALQWIGIAMIALGAVGTLYWLVKLLRR
jgi:hypothetical protein